MARHKHRPGQILISGLADLGAALGYVVSEELPVDRTKRNPPAVDVAWLKEEGQTFPLMIFEIESRTTNSIANNAVKVFEQPNEHFEKPLFFFHVLLSGGRDTSRVETLRRLFGSHNYRTYRLDQDESTRLVSDVLSQHRRIERQIDLLRLIPVLTQDVWSGVDLDRVIERIEELQFQGNYLARYAALAVEYPGLLKHFLRVTTSDVVSRSNVRSWDHGTYIGNIWGEPIHIGLLALHQVDGLDPLAALRWWQEESTYMTMIGPHLGRSRDYDDFILGLAPPLLGLVAALMYKIQGAGSYILEQFRHILERLENASVSVSFYNAIWMTHVAAAIGDSSAYEWCRNFINDRGGVSMDVLLGPPSGVSFMDYPDNEWISAVQEVPAPVPPLADFRQDIRRYYGRVHNLDGDLTRLSLRVLSTETAVYNWATPIIQLLHGPSGVTLARRSA